MSGMSGTRLVVRGQVQGVGFRPAVWHLAREMGLVGDVRNSALGVEIRLWGRDADAFPARLRAALPAQARIEAIDVEPWSGPVPTGFEILASVEGRLRAAVTPDLATCPACLDELSTPGARRHRYPFTNCSQCGPRFSIIEGGPYDRARTTMAVFDLCAECAREYRDPADRRFHAQPIACPLCGPRVWLERLGTADSAQTPESGARGELMADAIDAAVACIRRGGIVAIRGLGGVHLACDATRADAVARLRQRKRRRSKAFALMARDLDGVRTWARVSALEAKLLTGVEAPIVLLRKSERALSDAVAPGLDRVGFMLPHTPLQHLLLQALEVPLVMTSGNRSGQPPCTTNDEVRTRLAGVADVALLHDRDIANRIDDSVVRVDLDQPRLLRRARGYAPAPLPLPPGFDPELSVLALGGDLKNAFCMVQNGFAVLSQHMGDLDDASTADEARHNLDLYRALYQHAPDCIAVDLHPQYHSARLGHALAGSCPVLEVQHHHAHIAACLAENRHPLDGPAVLGIALDGMGYGPGGGLWGGEFLLADYRAFQRLACIQPVPMPGGDAAGREPWRAAYAQLASVAPFDGWLQTHGESETLRQLAGKPLRTLDAMIRHGINAAPSSSCGRLFDAAAVCAGLAFERQDHEGQAAMALEAVIDHGLLDLHAEGYPFRQAQTADDLPCIDPAAVWSAMLEDRIANVPVGHIAARFHVGLARALVAMAGRVAGTIRQVALSGGCFQNAALFRLVHQGLEAEGFEVLSHSSVPANDGGIALGQALVALARHQGLAHVPRNSRPHC